MGEEGHTLPVRIVCGRYEDKIAWIQRKLQERREVAVVCKAEEVPLLARKGDCFISRTVRYHGMERICPDVAMLAGGTEAFIDLVFPQETFNAQRDGYWYMAAKLVLEDVYASSVFSFFRNSVSSKRHRVPAHFPDAFGPSLTDNVARMGKLLSANVPGQCSENLKEIPDEYKSNILSQVVRNASATASCIVSLVQGPLSALRDYSFQEEGLFRGVPDRDRAVFVVGDDLSNTMSAYLAGRVMDRPVISTGFLPELLIRKMKDITCCYRCQAPGEAFVFLPGRHPEFNQLLEMPSVTSLRALPVELPENLEPGEALIYEEGRWTYRDDILPDISFEPPVVLEKKGGDKGWLAPFIKKANDALYLQRKLEIKRKLRRRAHSRHPENDMDDEEDDMDFLSTDDLGSPF
jgi:hypothetical protein